MDMSEAKKKDQLPACPVETTLTLIGDKWKVLILRDLMPGTKRFSELRKRPGPPGGLCRGAAPGGVFPDPAGPEPEAHSGLHVGLGRGIQGIPGMKNRREALEKKKRFTAVFVIFSAEHR